MLESKLMKVLPFLLLLTFFCAACVIPHPPEIYVRSKMPVLPFDAPDLARPYWEKDDDRIVELRGRMVEVTGDVLDINEALGFTILELRGFRGVNVTCDISESPRDVKNGFTVGQVVKVRGINYGQGATISVGLVECQPL